MAERRLVPSPSRLGFSAPLSPARVRHFHQERMMPLPERKYQRELARTLIEITRSHCRTNIMLELHALLPPYGGKVRRGARGVVCGRRRVFARERLECRICVAGLDVGRISQLRGLCFHRRLQSGREAPTERAACSRAHPRCPSRAGVEVRSRQAELTSTRRRERRSIATLHADARRACHSCAGPWLSSRPTPPAARPSRQADRAPHSA